MDHKEAGQYWNDSAEAWTRLARMGCDEIIAAHPELQDAQIVSYFLHLRVRKPN